MTVLVVGDANVDLVLQGDVVPRFGQAEQLLDRAGFLLGGSASIVASGLARLGVPTALAAVVGDDELGRFTMAALRSHGVITSAVRCDTSTPTGLSVVLSSPADRAILTYPGSVSTLTAGDVRAAVATTRARIVHFASYFLMPDLAAGLPCLLRDVRACGTFTSLDTNWAPTGNWADVGNVLKHVDVILPNYSELRAIADALGLAGTDDHEYARALATLGPRVVVKAGRAGGGRSTRPACARPNQRPRSKSSRPQEPATASTPGTWARWPLGSTTR